MVNSLKGPPVTFLGSTEPGDSNRQIQPTWKDVWLSLEDDIATTPINIAIISGCINLFVPGAGSLLATYTSITGQEPSNRQIGISAFQFLTSFILVGYIWALYWSLVIAKKAFDHDVE